MNLYESIEKSIREHEESLHVSSEVRESDVRYAIRWVMRDNPDIFWFVHQYHFDEKSGKITLRYQFSKERSNLIQKSIDDVVQNDFQIDHVSHLTVLEQVSYVYKWLLTYCNYNVNSAYNQTIDSVFVRRNSVCTGYSKAAQYLFKLLGIDSRLVFGKLHNDREDGRHCWNMINIGSEWYHLDVSLGDVSLDKTLIKSGVGEPLRLSGFNYNFFCVSTETIAQNRSIEDENTLPISQSNLSSSMVEMLSKIDIKRRDGQKGCLLTHIGSSADIYLSTKAKNVVLKKFRSEVKWQCEEEFQYMEQLKGCLHLLQVSEQYSDTENNIIAIEQSTPIVDLFCSHYYHPTLRGMLMMIRDITLGWKECLERGILYRDIHVCNIYRTKGGTYKLGDFGSCTFMYNYIHERVGNPWFMSPETYITGQFDERSAVYSITAVLYFILNGLRPPFVTVGNESEALARKMKGETLPKPALLNHLTSDWAKGLLDSFIKRGCAYYPLGRIQSCQELINEIDWLLPLLGNNRIELQFVLQDFGSILNGGTVFDNDIPRNAYQRFAYGEEIERISASAANSCDIIYEPKVTYMAAEGAENYCRTMGLGDSDFGTSFSSTSHSSRPTNFTPAAVNNGKSKKTNRKFFCLFGNGLPIEVYSSVFAPAEVRRRSHLLVQVYLHLAEETEKVKSLAQESDKNAERRDYIPLKCKLKRGDKVDIILNIYGESVLFAERKLVVWQGSFTKCSFDYFVPKDIDVDELSCVTMLTVNGIPVGEMRFITRIVDVPRQLNPEVIAHKYNKVFISYSHQDESKVKFLHEGLELGSVPHFFDRKYLKAGDVFPQVIKDYINSADLFILCWSENASKSEYVQKERLQALERAFPQVKPEQEAKLRIYPLSIEPRAELPSDMKENYHFGEI